MVYCIQKERGKLKNKRAKPEPEGEDTKPDNPPDKQKAGDKRVSRCRTGFEKAEAETQKERMMKVAYEIHTGYKGYKLHRYEIATFELDRMRSAEATIIDSNGRSRVETQKEYQLSYWQKAVSLDEFIRVMEAKGFCPRIIT